MLKLLVDAMFFIFALCGIFAVCFVLINKFLCSSSNGKFAAVIAGYPDDEKLFEKVYVIYNSINLMNFIRRYPVVIVDFGVDEKTKKQCKEISSCDGMIEFCKTEDLRNIAEFFVER